MFYTVHTSLISMLFSIHKQHWFKLWVWFRRLIDTPRTDSWTFAQESWHIKSTITMDKPCHIFPGGFQICLRPVHGMCLPLFIFSRQTLFQLSHSCLITACWMHSRQGCSWTVHDREREKQCLTFYKHTN